MLAALDIREAEASGLLFRLHSAFRPYEIKTKIKKRGKVSVMYISYFRNRGKVRSDRIVSRIPAVCCEKILCDDSDILKGTRFERFEDDTLKKTMLFNFAVKVLSEADSRNLRVGLYDPSAEYPSFAKKLISSVPSLTIVTEQPRFYENESLRLEKLIGASYTVGNEPAMLSPCDVIAAPDRIDIPLPIRNGAVVFTYGAPLVSVKGIVIKDYKADCPQRYKSLIPEGKDTAYFMSAFYTLCGAKELGTLVPSGCYDGSSFYSSESIISMIKKLSD